MITRISAHPGSGSLSRIHQLSTVRKEPLSSPAPPHLFIGNRHTHSRLATATNTLDHAVNVGVFLI